MLSIICLQCIMCMTMSVTERLDMIERFIQELRIDRQKAEADRQKADADRKDYWKKFNIIDGFIKKEADAIEYETARAVYTYLVDRMCMGYKVYIPAGFPAKLYHPLKAGLTLTDLDGVFILTNNPSVQEDHVDLSFFVPLDEEIEKELRERKKEMNQMRKSLSSSQTSVYDTQLVIIEAKHHVTEERIDFKLNQLSLIEEWLADARLAYENPSAKQFVPSFIKNVKTFKVYEYNPKPLLFIGGPLWDKQAVKLFKDKLLEPQYTDNLFMVQTNGSRFQVVGKATTKGGSKSKSKTKVVGQSIKGER